MKPERFQALKASFQDTGTYDGEIILECLDDIKALQSRLQIVKAYEPYPGVRIENCNTGDVWCIRRDSCCMNKSGEWVYEHSPSNRTKEFLLDTRMTLDEAFALSEKFKPK